MTDIQDLFANGVDHIIGYEIGKDMTRDDMAIVRSYFIEHADEHNDPIAFVEGLILNDAFPITAQGDPGPGAPPTKPSSHLSIKVEDGKNLYLIRLTGASDGINFDTRAKWGPGNPPLSFLPENVHGGNKPLKQIRLAIAEAGRIRYIPETAIPARIDDLPDGAWILFRCDHADMADLWKRLGYNPKTPFLIPFRYNLFDRETKTPIWNVDHDHNAPGDDHDHADANKAVTTHGGKHPNDAGKGTMTHGGKHPNDAIKFLETGALSIKRGRTHGGIHPNTLVEYFYTDPPRQSDDSGLS